METSAKQNFLGFNGVDLFYYQCSPTDERLVLKYPYFQYTHIHVKASEWKCTLRVIELSLPIENFSHSLKLIRCPTQAKRSSSMLTKICRLPLPRRLHYSSIDTQ